MPSRTCRSLQQSADRIPDRVSSSTDVLLVIHQDVVITDVESKLFFWSGDLRLGLNGRQTPERNGEKEYPDFMIHRSAIVTPERPASVRWLS